MRVSRLYYRLLAGLLLIWIVAATAGTLEGQFEDEEALYDDETFPAETLYSDETASDLLKGWSFRQRLRYRQTTTESTVRQYYQLSELQRERFRIGFIAASDSLRNIANDARSYYLFYSGETILKSFVAGRYRLALGQGIAYAPPFGMSKSGATVTHPLKSRKILRPHTSPFHYRSLEGLAAVISTGNFSFVPFISATKLHCRLEEDKIRTIYAFGEHRSEHRNQATETIAGLAVNYELNNSVFGSYYSRNRFDRQFYQPQQSNDYQTMGIFFNHHFERLSLFGEYAKIDEKQGLITGARWGKAPFRQLLLYRHYEKRLPLWHGNPFSAAASFDNEEGIYYGIEANLARGLKLNLFFDVWQYPGTSYYEKMPVTRSDRFLQLVKSFDGNRLRLRIRHKDYDKYRVIDDVGRIRKEEYLTATLDWDYALNKETTIRSSMQFSDRYIRESRSYAKGVLFYENIRWRRGRFDVAGQVNVFNAEVVHYIYERSLTGMWESRSLTGDDVYVWLMTTIAITPEIKLENKVSWYYGKKRTAVNMQVSYGLGG